MNYLLDIWEEKKHLFINPIFLMTDFDGTLVPIESSPEVVELSKEMKNLLQQLVSYCPIGVISGRALDDLKEKIDVDGIYYSGNHGFELQGPNVSFIKEEARQAEEIIEKICDEVRKETRDIEGVLIENKRYTASFHYRLVDEDVVPKLKKILREKTEPYRERKVIKTNYGKKVFEISPAVDWDKGKALSLLNRVAGVEEGSLTVYLGDDITDEDAFYKIKKTGIGILVSDERRETAAKFLLKDSKEVKIFFRRLLGLLRKT